MLRCQDETPTPELRTFYTAKRIIIICVVRYNNNAIPTIPSLVKICDAFQITLSEFFAKAEGSESVPVALTPQQMQIIEKWSILRPDQQEAVLNLLNTIP